MAFVLTLSAFLSSSEAWANPIFVANRFFISREDLRVRLGTDYADIEGVFQIQKPPGASNHNSSLPITITVPLYVPTDTNGLFRAFWAEAKPVFMSSTLPEEAAKVLQGLSGIRLENSDRVVYPRRYEYASLKKERRVPPPPPGMALMWCDFALEAKAVQAKDSLRLFYRQHHSQSDGCCWFTYTPLFSDSADYRNPKGAWLKHPEEYLVSINAPQTVFTVVSKHERVLLHSSQRLVLQPRHQESIVLQVANPAKLANQQQPYSERHGGAPDSDLVWICHGSSEFESAMKSASALLRACGIVPMVEGGITGLDILVHNRVANVAYEILKEASDRGAFIGLELRFKPMDR